jgi:hypothetical protein
MGYSSIKFIIKGYTSIELKKIEVLTTPNDVLKGSE